MKTEGKGTAAIGGVDSQLQHVQLTEKTILAELRGHSLEFRKYMYMFALSIQCFK